MLGVNLGSWLVLEQYMVPHIYSLVKGSPYGERQLMQVRTPALRGQVPSMCTPCSASRST